MASHEHATPSRASSGRLEALKARHAALSRRIDREARSPARQDQDIRRMKLEKLKLKDEIERNS